MCGGFLALTATFSGIDGIHQVNGYIQLTNNLFNGTNDIMSTHNGYRPNKSQITSL